MTGRSNVRITVWAGFPMPDHSVSLKHFRTFCRFSSDHQKYLIWWISLLGPSEGRWHPDPAWVWAWGQEVEMSDLPQETSYVWNLENPESCCTFKLLRLPIADGLTPSVSEETKYGGARWAWDSCGHLWSIPLGLQNWWIWIIYILEHQCFSCLLVNGFSLYPRESIF